MTRTCSACHADRGEHAPGCPEMGGQFRTLAESEAAVRTCRHPKPRYGPCVTCDAEALPPLLTEVLTLSDAALVAFVDFIRFNDPKFTRDPSMIRRVFTAYVTSDGASA